MRKCLLVLVALVVANVSVVAVAQDQVCPMYKYGEWNGMHYYYCLSLECSGPPQSAQSSTEVPADMLGCDATPNCRNPIRPLLLQRKAIARQIKYVKPRADGEDPGVGEDDASTFFNSPRARHWNRSDQDLLKVQASDGPRYFRTLDVEVDRGNKRLEAYIGQELDKLPAGVVPLTATIVTSTTDKLEHELKVAKQPGNKEYRYKVTTVKEMK